jgi:acetyl esterase/lipase
MPYGREQMHGIAQDLVSVGCAVWNIEYRRLGGAAAGWLQTCQDAAQAIHFLARLQAEGADLDLDRVAVIGHSAGGHLALWAAARQNLPGGDDKRLALRAVVAEAPLSDLRLAYEMGIEPGIVARFLGGTPGEASDACRSASPRELLPIRVPQFILHGTADASVPVEMSRAYAKAAKDAGDWVELIELPGLGHMEFLDPASGAHGQARDVIRRLLGPATAG